MTTEHADLKAELVTEAGGNREDAESSGCQHLLVGQHWRRPTSRLGLPATLLSAPTSAGAGLSALKRPPAGWAFEAMVR